MRNLDYKGIRSTRLVLTALVMGVATVILLDAYLDEPFAIWLNFFDQWLSTCKWVIGIYAASEVAAKGSEAYRDK